MAIYLENFERNYLLSLIEGTKYTGDRPIEVPEITIPKKIRADQERLDDTSVCNHTFGKYTGEKICCTKCGTYDEGMGYTWKFESTVDSKTYVMPEFENPQGNLFA